MSSGNYATGIFVLLALAEALQPNEIKQYRTDYEYNRKTNAFYKLHTETLYEYRAKEHCEVEGAKLMVPTTHEDIVQAHGMFKKYSDLGSYVWVASDGISHDSVEEQPLIEIPSNSQEDQVNFEISCDVMTNDGTVKSAQCHQKLPFICKVDANDAPYDSHCDVYATDYHYYQEVGSCYKITNIALVWNEAYAECKAEGAHLAVINSVREHDIIQNLSLSVTPSRLSKHSWYFIIGFRAIAPSREFKTVFNQTLEEAGYSDWSYTEPNNMGGNEYCGSILKSDGKLNDVNCLHKYAYICEKEIPN